MKSSVVTLVVAGLLATGAAAAADQSTAGNGSISTASSHTSSSAAHTNGSGAAQNGPPPTASASNPYLMGDRYQQASAEVEALQLQAYNVATRRLTALLAQYKGKKKPAIVMDIDETILNNAAYEAAAVKDGFSYPAHWKQWVDAAEAPLIPGAGKFLSEANAKGVAIFYVSNRKTTEQAATIKNLKQDGLPQVSKNSVRLAGPSKAVRRQEIAKRYDILLLMGDTLHDVDAAYAGTSLLAQHEAVERQANRFGSRYIILPNAMYGTWTHAQLSAWQPPNDNQPGNTASRQTSTPQAPAGKDTSTPSATPSGARANANSGAASASSDNANQSAKSTSKPGPGAGQKAPSAPAANSSSGEKS